MRLRIVSIADRGIAQNERLHLSVLADTNLVNYVVLDTIKISSTAISTSPKHVFWLPSYPVKPGDNVVIYTRAGVQNNLRRRDGGADHFFFWGLDRAVWGDSNACAVVLELNDWATSP